MDSSSARARRRRWADITVLFAALFTIVFAVWVVPVEEAEGTGAGTWSAGGWWAVHAVAGTLALLALLVSFRSASTARLMVGAAGAGLIAFLVASGGLGTLSLLTAGLPGALLLAAAPFMGPMPAPEEEGKAR